MYLHRYLCPTGNINNVEVISEEIKPYTVMINGCEEIVENVYTAQYLKDICDYHVLCSLHNSPGTPERLRMTLAEYMQYEFNWIYRFYRNAFRDSGYDARSKSLLLD